ncbi:hypothetical protein [Novosphingobium sp. Rr 2-17]|uniref:hypothetical protein n=1 Tax=Novosphingobium sp. Rr 2-17 TaxID=555793 RepID=UPI0003153C96|nr:hypothetical protein [Novosphingobium sp. Rr 2-17]
MIRTLSTTLVVMAAGAAGVSGLQAKDRAPSEPLALEALHNFAACAVKRTPEGALKLLSLDPESPEFQKARLRFAKGHSMCAGGGNRLGFSGLILSGDLAEAVIATKYPAGGLVAAAARANPTPVNTVEAIGICVAKAKPAQVSAVLATVPASEAEVAALQSTADVLPGCVPAGKTIKLNRPAVRAIYALGAYRVLAGTPEKPKA